MHTQYLLLLFISLIPSFAYYIYENTNTSSSQEVTSVININIENTKLLYSRNKIDKSPPPYILVWIKLKPLVNKLNAFFTIVYS